MSRFFVQEKTAATRGFASQVYAGNPGLSSWYTVSVYASWYMTWHAILWRGWGGWWGKGGDYMY